MNKRIISKSFISVTIVFIISTLLTLIIVKTEANRINLAKAILPSDNADDKIPAKGETLKSDIGPFSSDGNLFADNNVQAPKTEESILTEELGVKSLQLAIRDLINTHGSSYPKGEIYLKEIDKQLKLYQSNGNQAKAKAANALYRIRKEALLSNPLVTNSPILFVVRNQYVTDHGAPHTVYNTGKYDYNGPQGTGPSRADINIPGAALKMLDLEKGERITTIIDCPDGWIREPDVYWDGTKIIFSMKKNRKDNYHIYEINVDGTGLKQLTFLKDIDDITPLYLPDNDIVFSSTRELKHVPCNRHRIRGLANLIETKS